MVNTPCFVCQKGFFSHPTSGMIAGERRSGRFMAILAAVLLLFSFITLFVWLRRNRTRVPERPVHVSTNQITRRLQRPLPLTNACESISSS